MEALKKWCERNTILYAKVVKGADVLFKDSAADGGEMYELLNDFLKDAPAGTYRILGKESKDTTDANSLVFPYKTETEQKTMTTQNGFYSMEQVQNMIELERKKWQFEDLDRRFNKLESRVEKQDELLKKVIKAVEILTDDDETNDKDGISKLVDIATNAKTLFADL